MGNDMGNGTKEPQYNELFEVERKFGRSKLGLMTNQSWNEDPKRLVFTLSRYKFVAKMLSDQTNVLEVGCADAFGSRIVAQAVKNLTVTDFDPVFIDDVKARASKEWPMEVLTHDFMESPINGNYDAAYALDVLEHISSNKEDVFLTNIKKSISKSGVLIIGMPSLESQIYASHASKIGHVNCKKSEDLKSTLHKHFVNVFIFSMNDEVVHTGFHRMANYILAVCTSPR
jgi:2-polyprenyl-3-methyl-5-hydroxy-6-metoxy-1,4-benzoquinol methylase